MEKSSEVYIRKNNGPKTLPCSTPDTMLTSLLLQSSTITCCDRSDRNSVKIDYTEPPNTHRTELIQNSLMVDPIKGCAEINLYDPSLLPTLQCTLRCMRHAQKFITCTRPFRKANCVVGRTPLRSINRPRRTDTRRSNTLDNTDVMEIGW